MAKKKLKRRVIITCQYCKNYSAPNKCSLSKSILVRGPITPACKSFESRNHFHCERYGQRLNILTCLHRRNCVKHRVRFYSSYSKCRRCKQYLEIKKIAKEEDLQPKSVIQIKRRNKPIQVENKTRIKRRNKPVPKIKRRDKPIKIKRRDKPTKIKRRSKNGKQGKRI